MKRTLIILFGFFLCSYFFALFIFNKPSVTYQEAVQIAVKTTPMTEGYRISQIEGGINRSFILDTNPSYRFIVITVKTESGLQHKEYKIKIDGKTKEILGIEAIV
ncbi:hypothetical protein SAMN05216378_3698 [Paenibacillus catalpae]|uniref:Peptidase propeptide and YPEB domain-containing protein n=1 Tax=Paenibacillus catalpae TaxID=1045775 RepID=A0A1I2BWR4_9BACL|nr:hypothetical protein [Paenibacillus catalpae]SFE60517.1 hypothetical protein SAMN05216378_3698 [Paenibacillus catalpae]